MPRRQHQKEKLHALMKDGSVEIDNNARKIGSQVVSDILQGVALPGRQLPTPSFVHKELNRAPAPQDGYHVETVDPITVEMDSQFQAQDARAMWDGARNGQHTEADAQSRFERRMMGLFALVGALFMFLSVGMAFQAHGDPEEAEKPGRYALQPTPEPTPTPVPILPRVGGN